MAMDGESWGAAKPNLDLKRFSPSSKILAQAQAVVDRGVDVVHRDAIADAEQQENAHRRFLLQRRLRLGRIERVDDRFGRD